MDTNPRERLPWLRPLVCVLATLVGAYYIGWRLLFTLNTGALWLAIPLWMAEAYGLLASALFFYTVWDTRPRRTPGAVPAGLTVDVMVPTYNEPVWVVRRTLVGALAMTYPHRTWLLDDGRRPEMERLARELGCGYITRPDNSGAKAGNLNWALGRTSGDVVAVFDADHVPLPAFLERTLPYFADPRLAFVQTPQEYYNTDSFQHLTDTARKRTWHEQSLFYRVIQPGKDRWNAAFFCGSCGVIRRAALEDVGGFATETITEDMHTSVRMHARGWSSAYHNEVLALGLAAQTATPYHVQRLRWGQGTMQVIRRERLLLRRGLTLHQRINYLASALHYFDGLQRLLYYVIPPLCAATGVLPIASASWGFVPRLLAYYGTSFLAFKLSGRGYAMFLATERYHMVRFYTYLRTLTGLLRNRRLRFAVSPKSAPGRPERAALIPSVAVGLYVGVCIGVGVSRLAAGAVGNIVAFAINVVWSLWVAALALSAMRLTLRKVDFRAIPRAHAGLPVRWRAGGEEGVGVLSDLSERGAAILMPPPPEGVREVAFDVLWPGTRVGRAGTVRRVVGGGRAAAGGAAVVGLEWREPEGETAVQLSRLAAELTARHYLLDFDEPWDRLGLLELRRGYRRRSRRVPASVAVRLGHGAGAPWAVTEDVSDEGALVLSPVPLPAGTALDLVRADGACVRGTVVRCEEVALPPGDAWRLGMRLDAALLAASAPRAGEPAIAA